LHGLLLRSQGSKKAGRNQGLELLLLLRLLLFGQSTGKGSGEGRATKGGETPRGLGLLCSRSQEHCLLLLLLLLLQLRLLQLVELVELGRLMLGLRRLAGRCRWVGL